MVVIFRSIRSISWDIENVFFFIKGGTKSTEKEAKTDFSSIVEYTKKREHLPSCNLQYISS